MPRLCSFLLSLLIASAADAEVLFAWEGSCAFGCIGTASGVLTVSDGTVSPFGFTRDQFISWEYASSSGTFYLDNSSPYLTAVGSYDQAWQSVFLEENGQAPNPSSHPLFQFVQYDGSPSANWQFLIDEANPVYPICLNEDCSINNYTVRDGGTGQFLSSPVPEPGTGLLVIAGLLGLAGWRRARA